MSNTVVGIFEYTSEAQAAKEYLLKNGYADESVDIEVQISDDATSTGAQVYKEESGDRISDFFKNLFGDDDDEVNNYTQAGRKGTILTVHADSADEAEAAAHILDNYGAVDVHDYASKITDTSGSIYNVDGAYGAPQSDVSDTNPDTIKVIEEDFQVGKREVQTGGIRLKSRIVERPVEENIRLRQEYVSVERTPVNRIATEADFETFKEGTIELTEYAEVPVVSKEARVVEEVSLRKDVEVKDELITDTVRSTEVETEDLTDEEKIRKSGFDI
ncbi:YsnF/AvaK domain-containing protein [Dyadobacter sp. NIV53]|uniref:YsnF/AvaK domain-containing protein n=1 Tax=Dyadobacter sp. NIV53 TaxID=2861765 RepID=UPI001C880DC1|nr:YsnF/AvaK domain-containing protein [Dyadobacter sp. NIV53]